MKMMPLLLGVAFPFQAVGLLHRSNGEQVHTVTPVMPEEQYKMMIFSSVEKAMGGQVPVVPAAVPAAPVAPAVPAAAAAVPVGPPVAPVVPAPVPDAGCTPTCTWQCPKSTCNQVCTPKCQPPQCQTRCSGMNTNGCQMECGKPRCVVVCPPQPCAASDCPICKTTCSKPMCHLKCPDGGQDCKDVCENPSCTWQCKAPSDCAAPACSMKCDPPKACAAATYQQLPALQSGETIIGSFETPLSLLNTLTAPGGGRLQQLVVPVDVTQAVEEVPGSGELKLVHSTIRVPVM